MRNELAGKVPVELISDSEKSELKKEGNMSTFSHLYEERLCRICGGYDREYANGHYILWQTSVRAYAHPACMVEKFGRKEALAMVKHKWQVSLFKKALKFPIVKGDKHPMLRAVR